MQTDDPKTLVSTQWLAAHLQDPELRVLDASWYLPAMGRDARAEYDAAHIPGARFFDIDEISDLHSDLPHMVPPQEKFMPINYKDYWQVVRDIDKAMGVSYNCK